ncbi:MAG: hypothetical protein R2713_17910 [Ilumatobacteraceae bacterium]
MAATAACLAVLGLAFVLPATRLVAWAIDRATGDDGARRWWTGFVEFLGHSLQLAGVSAVVCVVICDGRRQHVRASATGTPRRRSG